MGTTVSNYGFVRVSTGLIHKNATDLVRRFVITDEAWIHYYALQYNYWSESKKAMIVKWNQFFGM